MFSPRLRWCTPEAIMLAMSLLTLAAAVSTTNTCPSLLIRRTWVCSHRSAMVRAPEGGSEASRPAELAQTALADAARQMSLTVAAARVGTGDAAAVARVNSSRDGGVLQLHFTHSQVGPPLSAGWP